MADLLYLDGSCGISGDMTVAALLDLGGDRAALDAALAPLAAEGLAYAVSRKDSHGLAGLDFDVRLPDVPHGHGHHHAHRHLTDVEALLTRLPMAEPARALALKTFRIVAEAEAKAHGCALAEVHFHEVGALDSLADIVGAAVLFHSLGLGGCVVTRLCEGTGTVVCAHGELPIPAPATRRRTAGQEPAARERRPAALPGSARRRAAPCARKRACVHSPCSSLYMR